ncbi:hypothetical protein HDU93_006979, partial [Gonapodya sp. JEL0774]
ADPLEYPIVDHRFLEHPDDVEVLMRGMRMSRKVAAAEPLKEMTIEEIVDPEVAKYGAPDSKEYMERYIRSKAVTVYHPTSTCRMGPDSDRNTVVDLSLKVKGVKNLRVVDASVFPDIVMGNTNAPVYAVAER